MARELHLPMKPALEDGPDGVALPIVTVRLRRGDGIGRKYDALVDTGAMRTVASMDVAGDFGMDPGTVRRSPDRVPLAGAGGELGEAWGWDFELHLGEGETSKRIVLTSTKIYFAEWGLGGFYLVLGQRDLLKRLAFSQANHGPRPSFTLRVPTRR